MATDQETPDGYAYGRALTGFGVNLLVSDIKRMTDFLSGVFGLTTAYSDREFAIIRHSNHEFMLHHDSTYGNNPMLTITGDVAIRGAGVELRLYGCDPDQACERASKSGHDILQPAADKLHGLREAYIAGPDQYIWVPGIALPAADS